MKNCFKKLSIGFIAFSLIANVFVGCTPQSSNAPKTTGASQLTSVPKTTGAPKSAGAPQKITVVLDWPANTNHTGMYVAKELGYYADVGLEVNMVQAPDGDPLPMLAAGKGDFGVSSQEVLAMALSSKTPLKVTAVAALIQHNTSGIISLKKSNVTSPKKMEGLRYGAWGYEMEKAILKSIMSRDGGDVEKVKIIPIPVTDVISALKTNIDLVWIYYGWDGIAAQAKNLDFNYFDLKDYVPELDYYTPFLASSDAFLAKNPEVTKKFLAATAKGYAFAVANPIAAADLLLKYSPDTNQTIAYKSQEFLAKEYIAEAATWGQFDAARWSQFYAWLYANKITETDLGVNGFTNNYLSEVK
ncbi:MAG: ABC transporter substrate-binding protein [Clostridia bacterium]